MRKILFLCITLLFVKSTLFATDWYVTKTGAGTQTGTDWDNAVAFKTIFPSNKEISTVTTIAVNDGDVIIVAGKDKDGMVLTYDVNNNATILDKVVTIKGGYAIGDDISSNPDPSKYPVISRGLGTVKGQNLFHILGDEGKTFVFDGLIISDFKLTTNSPNYQGVINLQTNNHSNLMIRNCTFRNLVAANNLSGYGCAVLGSNPSNSVTETNPVTINMENCIVENCSNDGYTSGLYLGGTSIPVANKSIGSLVVLRVYANFIAKNCKFNSNSTGAGALFYTEGNGRGASFSFEKCTFNGNTVKNYASLNSHPAMFMTNSPSATMANSYNFKDCGFYGNSAPANAILSGILNKVTIDNSFFINNKSVPYAIYADKDASWIPTDNSNYATLGLSDAASVTVTNSIISNNAFDIASLNAVTDYATSTTPNNATFLDLYRALGCSSTLPSVNMITKDLFAPQSVIISNSVTNGAYFHNETSYVNTTNATDLLNAQDCTDLINGPDNGGKTVADIIARHNLATGLSTPEKSNTDVILVPTVTTAGSSIKIFSAEKVANCNLITINGAKELQLKFNRANSDVLIPKSCNAGIYVAEITMSNNTKVYRKIVVQ